ncbi:MAG TPA: GAF domain-containing protein [Actinomycetospora sp.]|uniref:GAF domain-containing protein n=1 Tax=Actinomycetospora sp. TaxID=1872135 RepID=UPI002F40A61B
MMNDSAGGPPREWDVSRGAYPSSPDGTATSLDFPRVARLALDELLDELVSRAEEVKATQGRLRGLLAATHHIAVGLDHDELRGRIVESARTLTGARYAALAVVREGRFVDFVHRGMGPAEVAAIGRPPVGTGLMGFMAQHPEPLRLDDMSRHPAAAGLPEHHPPVTSLLAVPVRVRGARYGTLLLGEAPRGRFGDDDEELVVALAAAAGLAIENALLYDDARRRERWQAVSTQITRDLLADDLADRDEHGRPAGQERELGDRAARERWHRLLELAMATVGADGGAICEVPAEDECSVLVLAAAGTLTDWRDTSTPRDGSITDAALDAAGPVLIDDIAGDARTTATAARVPRMRRAVAGRLHGADAGRSRVIMLARDDGGAPFGPLERDMIDGLADHVATALALHHARDERAAQRRADSNERLARHLNDEVMGQLMRLGLDLAGLATQVSPDLLDDVLGHIDTLDHLSRHIRDTVFSLDVS